MSEQTLPVLRCRSCGAAVPDEQEWCLECGYGARTRIVPPPRFRRPLTSLLLVATTAFAVLAFAFAKLTADDGRVPRTVTTTTPAPAAATTSVLPAPTTPVTPVAPTTPLTPTNPATPTTTLPSATAPPPLSAP